MIDSENAVFVAEMVSTTQTASWQHHEDVTVSESEGFGDVMLLLDQYRQTVDGFGACFNELGWIALNYLGEADRESILREIFAPGAGANFTLCRMPIGANDFSRDWYSYDEVPGDFALEQFSIENDLETLVPFIHHAQRQQPDLKLWASPWSPPTWMKLNKHYAAAMPWPGSGIDNGLRPEQVGQEGTDMFIQEEAYLASYARYFGRFIDAYGEQGISVGMVMPQNEFNSPQMFPSCTWTPEGLARFIRYLGPEMARREVEIFLGTLERANERLVDPIFQDPEIASHVQGIGFQWAGKGAITCINRQYAELKLYQTEQECGDGQNDWRYCRYAWTLMKHYLKNGANAYHYWNIALQKGGSSRWGWRQNSLVTVDPETRTFTYNPEYYLMKHVSHFVKPGAKRLETMSVSGYDNLLAFVNTDESIVIVIQNDLCAEIPVRISTGRWVITPTLPADSFNTVVLKQ